MKKILMVSVCLLVAVALMVGCTAAPAASSSPAASVSAAASSEASQASTAASSEASQAVSANEDLPKYKIGWAWSSLAAPDAIQIKTQLDGIAKDFNCEIVAKETPTRDLEGLLAANEALIKEGCNGILTVALTPAMAQQCIDAKVSFALFASAATDPELLAVVKGSPYFVGSFGMDAAKVGYDAAQSVYDAGLRNICYIAPPAGMETHDQWVQGIEAFAKDHPDFKIITSSRDAGTSPAIDLFRQMYSAFPNIDCVIETACDQTLVPGLYTDNLQSKVKYASLSAPGDVTQGYNDGCVILTGVAGAGYVDLTFAALYNAISGNNLITDNSVPVMVGYSTIKSTDEYAKYINTISKAPFYTADELKKFCPVFNPAATYDDFAKAAAALSLQDIITRHGIQ